MGAIIITRLLAKEYLGFLPRIDRIVFMAAAAGVWATVLFGTLLALEGRMTPGDLLVFVAYISGMGKPLRGMAKLSLQFSKAMVSSERIAAILEEDAETAPATAGMRNLRLQGDIEFRDVSFHYGNEAAEANGGDALQGVSFRVRAGERVALVGPSGAGKSTIANLILRFYTPQSGRILIDGADIAGYDRESLRRQIGVVLQDSFLLGASIHENIAYGKPDATAREVEQAAREACAHDFILGLPGGYDAEIGERGATLSGGQRQRIGLARAILKRPSILLLDEPTSSVDAESAALILKSIERLQQGKTTIVIAHQFRGMDSYDRIVVLRGGRIVEQGSHAGLLDQRGYYYELFLLQSAAGEEACSPCAKEVMS
jgi:ABC-type multidrug transport system fused ATPase/permease subunit